MLKEKILQILKSGEKINIKNITIKLGEKYEDILDELLSLELEGLVESFNGEIFKLKIKEETSLNNLDENFIKYNFSFLKNYIPNETFLLGRENIERIKNEIKSLNITLNYTTNNIRLLEKTLIDISYSSSHLEGNTYNIFETENLIKYNEEATKKTFEETKMILNHKKAISFIINNKEEIKNSIPIYNKVLFQNIHSLLADGLIANSKLGIFRTELVRIGGSRYIPLENKFQIEEEFNLFLEKLNKIKEPLEQSFFILVFIAYLQSFIDVNKRTSRISSNIPLILNGLPIISLIKTSELSYKTGIIKVYEKNETDLLAKIYTTDYLSSLKDFKSYEF